MIEKYFCDVNCAATELNISTTVTADVSRYWNSGTLQLRTLLPLMTLCQSPHKTVFDYIAIALGITDSRYYDVVDTLCGPQ